MLVAQGNLRQDSLNGEIAVVTGGGRGIGYETARALIWMGAIVVIAEINECDGKSAVDKLEEEFGPNRAVFFRTDVGDEKEIEKLSNEIMKRWGKVDAIINNATVFPMGAVMDVGVERWDRSYRVNLRGPVLLARTFLPDMIRRRHGVIVCVSSSGAAPFMGAYEVFKTAQGELASTIAAEVEGKGVYAFTIGPGIAKTPGFLEGGGQVAVLMGKTLEELLDMNKSFEISPEAAGVGFAASVALAAKYHGTETSSIQVLREIGIVVKDGEADQAAGQEPEPAEIQERTDMPSTDPEELYQQVTKTYREQSEGWKKRGLFERQWVVRDFKKNTGMTIDEMRDKLQNIDKNLNGKGSHVTAVRTLKTLAAYYEHQLDQLKGFEKNPKKLQDNLVIIDGWIREIRGLVSALP
jgi:NAD(P)-dependent dehydrogenase (short-subunit alcohol dehydrogenase family)